MFKHAIKYLKLILIRKTRVKFKPNSSRIINYLHGSGITQKQSHEKLVLLLYHWNYSSCTQIQQNKLKYNLKLKRTRNYMQSGIKQPGFEMELNLLAFSRWRCHYAGGFRGRRGWGTWGRGWGQTWSRRREPGSKISPRTRTTKPIRTICRCRRPQIPVS